MKAIWELEKIVSKLSLEEKELFHRFYTYYVEEGRLVLPESLKNWAYQKFGENCENQKIVRIINNFTFESTLFNELRAKRPIDVKESEDIKKIVEDTKGDAFCNPLEKTPSDPFGRIEGKHCITASNIAKYDYIHAVIVFKNHDPYSFSEEEVLDYFDVAERWFLKAHEVYPDAIYPFFMWNCLWKAGASIVHGHAQALISKIPYGKWMFYKQIRDNYEQMFDSEYLLDLYKVHELIGLGLTKDGIMFFAHLTPVKEKEVILIGESFKDLAWCVSRVLQAYYELGVRSFNVAGFLPELGTKDWVFVKIVDRGDPGARTVDIGGMELYSGTSVVASDPFRVFEFISSRL
ncbi:MAG: hypothetical protein GXO57_00830 [Thermodesulfobacteria bacterium]|nr:hypothetical protein [Thermodesulfobacteriota bacterium]